MQHLSVDVAIIGAGTAGLAAEAAAADAGAKTLLIESGPGGTTCARTGCMPSKLLIAAARAAHDVREVGTFGLATEGRLVVDGRAVMERVRRERDRFVASVLETTDAIPADRKLHGPARFVDGRTLVVGPEHTVSARAVVIATGSRPGVPAELRHPGDAVLTNETVFELADLPASLAVVGAGPLGIELAQAFARLGTAVTVFDNGDTVAGLADPEVERRAREILSGELTLRLGAPLESRRVADGVELSWTEKGGGSGRATFERVLAAAGRPPNVADLGLDQAGLALDKDGVPIFDRETMRCGESTIFIAGDADHDRPVLHEATHEGRIAGRNAARVPDVEGEARMAPFSIVFTDPEIAVVGGGWKTASSRSVVTGETDLASSGRARAMGRAAGLLRVYAEPGTLRILGGEMVGPDVEHLGHLLAWAVQLGLTAEDVMRLPIYHPTLEEALRSAVQDLTKR